MLYVFGGVAIALLGVRRLWAALEGPRTSLYGSSGANLSLDLYLFCGGATLIAIGSGNRLAVVVTSTVAGVVIAALLVRAGLVIRHRRRNREST